MGVMDKVKDMMKGRSDKVAGAVDTAVKKVDEKTGGKYSDKLNTGADKVKQTASNLDPHAAPTGSTGPEGVDESHGVGAPDPTAAGAAGLGADVPPRAVADDVDDDDR